MNRSLVAEEAIRFKNHHGAIPDDVIEEVVAQFTRGEMPKFQMAALLMAIRLRGMDYREILALTRAMAQSGDTYSFPDCVDKHSTGGVGDKISLTSLPIVAACGVPVVKLSGRSLEWAGGTIDKLESIPGLRCSLTKQQTRTQVEKVGLAIVETGDLAPADGAIYALRDVTGTVDSLPLIVSSIVSKKVATGAGHLLYDVKCGAGAFLKTVEQASELAEVLIRVSGDLGLKASAIITNMDNPLGMAVGNVLEVRESVRFLRGEQVPEDLAQTAKYVAVRLLTLKGVDDPSEAVQEALSSGKAYEKFRDFVAYQGGDLEGIEANYAPTSVKDVGAPRSGFVARFDAEGVARAAHLGTGEGPSTSAKHTVGVEVLVKAGEWVDKGQPVARLHGTGTDAEALVQDSLVLEEEYSPPPPNVLATL